MTKSIDNLVFSLQDAGLKVEVHEFNDELIILEGDAKAWFASLTTAQQVWVSAHIRVERRDDLGGRLLRVISW
jgi:hypothetical protein